MAGQVVWGVLVALLLAATVTFGVLFQRERARRKERDGRGAWPVRDLPLHELDPVFATGPFGPTRDTEVAFIGRGPLVVPGGTSDAEAWILAVLAKRAQRCFEFGTCTGKTAYLWARNAPQAQIVTLTLAPDQAALYARSDGDGEEDTQFALRESAFTTFLYSDTPEAARITQLYGDSKTFDDTPYHDWADLVFVDGSHAESYVASDSQKAMRMVRPGGLVLWHDYAGPRHAIGVFRALNAMAASGIALRRVQGTTLVAWRRP